MEKETKTLEYMETILEVSKNPVVLCSFGKDSMVMLHLLRKLRVTPVLFFKEPFFPKKLAFANKVIEDWNLSVYDFPPVHTDYIFKDDNFEVINWYNGFGNALLYLPTGAHDYKEGEDFLCAIHDLLLKPTVVKHSFPWDTIFVGHKSTDLDPILDNISLKRKTVRIQEMLLALPIAEWTDKDIWDYTVENGIPYNSKRYDKDNGFKEFQDKSFNNDYHPCCFKCLDNKESKVIKCPKSGINVNNVSTTDEQNMVKREKILAGADYIKSRPG